MSKTLYLLSLGLLILLSVLMVFQGARYINSPVALFQAVGLANLFIPLVLGPLLAIFLSVRFLDVFKGRVDANYVAARPAARAARISGNILIYTFYGLSLLAIASTIISRGQLGGEIGFLFGPLMRTLPFGLILFELGRILDGGRDD